MVLMNCFECGLCCAETFFLIGKTYSLVFILQNADAAVSNQFLFS